MKTRKPAVFFSLLLLASAASSAASWAADDSAPACMAKGKALPIDNAAIQHLKETTPNQYLTRAHVSGVVTNVFADENGHNHFEIRLDSTNGDTLEVIYNIEFGKLPELREGMRVEACGDYITSTAQAGSYPPSPDGAILHWVHENPKHKGHDSGYVDIDGKLYGDRG